MQHGPCWILDRDRIKVRMIKPIPLQYIEEVKMALNGEGVTIKDRDRPVC